MSLVQSIMSFIRGEEAAPPALVPESVPESVPEPPRKPERLVPEQYVKKAWSSKMTDVSMKSRLLAAAKKKRDAGEMDEGAYQNNLDNFGSDKDREDDVKAKADAYQRPLADRMIDAVAGEREEKESAERMRAKRERAIGDKEYVTRHDEAQRALRMYEAEKKKRIAGK